MSELFVEFIRGYAATNDWSAILPEICLALLALGILVAEIVLPRHRHSVIPHIAIWGQIATLLGFCLYAIQFGFSAGMHFSGLIEQNDLNQLMRIFFLLSSILVCYLGRIYLSRRSLARSEFYLLALIVTGGLMLLVQSANFVMFFVALETVTVAFYVLVAYCRTSSLSLEGGLKYLVLGALSSAVLLFGIVLLYGVGGNPELVGSSRDSLAYGELASFIILNPENLLVRVGALLVIAGVCFKIGAVPFQIWIPDVYQGAPTPVTAFLAIASKAGGFLVLLTLLTGPFVGLSGFLTPILAVIAAATILFGNIAAVTQRNVKRLMGFSGIAHAGYLLVGVIAAFSVPWAGGAVVFYLFAYMFASFAVFGVMALVSGKDDATQELEHYEDLGRRNPYLGGVLTLGLGSLAGIPPLGGFIGKLFLFVAAYQAALYGLLGIAILGVVISIYYYFRWVRECYFTGGETSVVHSGTAQIVPSDRYVLGALALATVIIGVFPAALPIFP